MKLSIILLISKIVHRLSHSDAFSMTEVGSILTQGGAGFEKMQLGGKHYMASANFWDGVDSKMRAESSIHRIDHLLMRDESSGGKSSGGMTFPVVQSVESWGAHGVDHIAMPVWSQSEGGGEQEMDLLVVPSFYGCERSEKCNATRVYYNWNVLQEKFTDMLAIPSAGPCQTDSFTRHDETYLVLAENFASQVSVYRLSASSSSPTETVQLTADVVQALPVPGVAACATALIDDVLYLIAASYNYRGWTTSSPVYSWSEEKRSFILLQTVPTTGAHDAETVSYRGKNFLFFSEDRNKDSVHISSNMYVWDPSLRLYVHLQGLRTDGAHAAEFFVMQDQLFLAVANFGDRHNRRYEAQSAVYMYVDSCADSASEQCTGFDASDHSTTPVSLGVFELQVTVPTLGATDWEYFELPSYSEDVGGEVFHHVSYFLAVSEEGDMKGGNGIPFSSRVYQLQN